MRTLHRARVHRVQGMPHGVRMWIEPTGPNRADVYLCADTFTEEEAHRLEVQLNDETGGHGDGLPSR